MQFIALLLAIILIWIIQYRIYSKHSLDKIEYQVHMSTRETFENEDVYIYEEISNIKSLPIPFAKVEFCMPEGLTIRLSGNSDLSGKSDKLVSEVESVFVLKGNQTISRRWRVCCKTRGIYSISAPTIIVNDLFGTDARSKKLNIKSNNDNTIVVLPRTVPLEERFISSYLRTGDISVNRALITDPLRIAGSREYSPFDPMNKINWKSTAVHGKLMVNSEEYTQSHKFNIIINIQSRSVERDPNEPSVPEFTDQCVTVCASILDIVSTENIPVKIIANTPPDSVGGDPVSDDETGEKILMTREYRGKYMMMDALRLLSSIQYKISCPIEQMLDHIIQNPSFYTSDRNIIFISPYIDDRMIVFHGQLKKLNINVVFYITNGNRNTSVIPDDIDIYFSMV